MAIPRQFSLDVHTHVHVAIYGNRIRFSASLSSHWLKIDSIIYQPINCLSSPIRQQPLKKNWARTARELQKGKIPLLLAVEAGNQSMCRELLAQQAPDQLRATTTTGDSALHLAARRRDIDMVRILVDYGATVDMQNVREDGASDGIRMKKW